MPPVFSKIKNKKLNGQGRELVANVLKFMENEATHGDFSVPVRKAQARTAAATGVSERMVRVIKQEASGIEKGEALSFTTPDKKRTRSKTVTNLDDFDQSVIRRTIHEFYAVEKCAPTVRKLKTKLEESIGFSGSYSSLLKILKQLGFKWAKTRNNRKVLVEKTDIRNKRISYIRQLQQFRGSGHPIVFMDESYILTSHTNSKGWADDSNKGLMVPINKGQRLIIVHAGGADGFIPNAALMWKANTSSGDYHDNMNNKNYMKWAKEKLLPNLKPNSVIVVDNAPYHNVEEDRAPTSNSRKEEMIKWLIDNGIPFTPCMFKPQLYELIKLNKPKSKKYVFDALLQNQGHFVLRLPPYHPDLNPIELIWAQLKNWVAAHNTTFKMEDIIKLCEQKLESIGNEEWGKVCAHVEKIEKEYLDREGVIDNEVERIVISLGGENSDSDSDNEDEEEDSDECLCEPLGE